jgi:hypothetical protein
VINGCVKLASKSEMNKGRGKVVYWIVELRSAEDKVGEGVGEMVHMIGKCTAESEVSKKRGKIINRTIEQPVKVYFKERGRKGRNGLIEVGTKAQVGDVRREGNGLWNGEVWGGVTKSLFGA